MPKQKFVEITVISTVIDNTKKYVTGLSRRSWDNKFIVAGLSSDVDHAQEFFTLDVAKNKIDRIVNHHNREYTAEMVTIPSSRRHAYSPYDDEVR
jgi:hypothetical protein